MERKSGVLLPVFSLPGKYGCGTFGQAAKDWIDLVKKGGFSLWQILPLGITDDFASPYMTLSSFGGNPYFIDPEELYRIGLVTLEELRAQEMDTPYLCDWAEIAARRLPFLKKAALRFQDGAALDAFFALHPELDEVCRFLALREANCGMPWQKWVVPEPDEKDVAAWRFIQYEFYREWRMVRDWAKAQKIEILGDIPFYVSGDSFDVREYREEFQIDEKGYPTAIAGVPPDCFSEEGQTWGHPLYNWETAKQNGFAYWRRRLKAQFDLFDSIRLDHFRAFSDYWSIPAGMTAKDGKWLPGPGMDFFRAIADVTQGKHIIAEDLGTVDDRLLKLLADTGLPGMAVFQSCFDGDPLCQHLPHNYRENLAAYSATHDSNTLLGYWFEMDEESRRIALDYLGYPADPVQAMMRALFMSRAALVVFPLQDLLGYGGDTRMNTPGVARGNWRVRFKKEQLDSLDTAKYAHWNHMYAR